MGDPCQVDKVVKELRPFQQRWRDFERDIRNIARVYKKVRGVASLYHAGRALEKFTDTREGDLARAATNDLNFALHERKTRHEKIDQIASVWMGHVLEETSHLPDAERTHLENEFFLWSEAQTDTVPAELLAKMPKSVESFLGAREFSNEIGRLQGEAGIGQPRAAATFSGDVLDKTTGDSEYIPAGGLSAEQLEWSREVFAKANGKYFPRLWLKPNADPNGNKPFLGVQKGRMLPKAAEQAHLNKRGITILPDAEAAKYTEAERKKNKIYGITEAKKQGLQTDLVSAFWHKMRAQTNLLAANEWFKAVNVNFARSFDSPEEAHAAGFAKVELVMKLSDQEQRAFGKNAPPQLKALAGKDVYIERDIAADMNALINGRTALWTMHDTVMNLFKESKTLWNPAYHTHNFASQALMASWTRHYNLGPALDSKKRNVFGVFSDAWQSYKKAKAGDKTEADMLDLAVRHGAFNLSENKVGLENAPEFDRLMETTLGADKAPEDYAGFLGMWKKAAETIKNSPAGKTANGVRDSLIRVSSMSDQLFRYGMFRDLIQRVGMTPEEASREVDNTFVRYDTLPNWAKAINRVSTFYSFNHALAGIVSNRVSDALHVIDDFRRGKLTAESAKEKLMPVVKMLSTVGTLGIINEMALARAGYTEEERELWKNSTPSIDMHLGPLPVSTGLTTPYGELNLTYSIPMPFGDVFFGQQIGQPLAYEGSGAGLVDSLGGAAKMLLASNPATTIIGESMAFEDFFTGQPLARSENTLTAGEKANAIAFQALEKFTPYWLQSVWRYVQEREVENVSRTGKKKSFGAMAAGLAGFPLANWNIEEAQARANIQLKSRINAIDEEIRKLQFDAARKKISREDAVARMRKQLERRRALVLGHPKASKETLSKAKEARLAAAGNG